jgi:hypothetical protein
VILASSQGRCARGQTAGCSAARNVLEGADAYAYWREPRQEDAESKRSGAVHEVNQLRTPNITMIAAACGFDAV